MVAEDKLLADLTEVNKLDFAAMVISEDNARKLNNLALVDFREKTAFEKGHLDGAHFVDYGQMFTKPMMEELNKSNNLVIVHDRPEVAGVIAMTLKLMDYPAVYILQ